MLALCLDSTFSAASSPLLKLSSVHMYAPIAVPPAVSDTDVVEVAVNCPERRRAVEIEDHVGIA